MDPAKDADGLHPANLGKLVLGEPGPLPCTPRGIVELLRLDDRTLRELLERAWLDMFGGVRPPDDFVSEARIYREAARVRERRLLRSLSAARRGDE